MKGGPFVYTKDGRLKRDEEIIIMECHGGCTCSEQCRNRVIQQGRKMKLKLKKTKKKGWGLFTKEAIPALTFIGVYGGEMITTTESDTRGDLYDTCFKGRTYQYGLDFHYQKTAANEPSFVVDAFWVGNYTRFLNHSCDPNCATFPAYIEETDLRKPFLVMFTTKDVKHGEELTFNYSGSSYDDDGNPKVCRENNICIYSMANWMYDSGGIRIKGADESVQVPLRFRKLS
ncbi:SET domain-containing protein [Clavulina sp. PMI_390]|nr:SET domain-containing protein [Clavulina sp. PMI_390]